MIGQVLNNNNPVTMAENESELSNWTSLSHDIWSQVLEKISFPGDITSTVHASRTVCKTWKEAANVSVTTVVAESPPIKLLNSSFPYMKHLDLIAAKNVDDTVVESLVGSQLTFLAMSCQKLTCKGYSNLNLLSGLQELRLNDCSVKSPNGSLNGLLSSLCNLQTLAVSRPDKKEWGRLFDENATLVFSKLKRLELENASHGWNDATLFPGLLYLQLTECGASVLNSGVKGIMTLADLQTLKLSGSSMLSYRQSSCTILPSLKALKEFHLISPTSMYEPQEKAVLSALAQLPNLVSLVMKPFSLGHSTQSALSKLTQLTHLELDAGGHGPSNSDESLAWLGQSFPRLASFDIGLTNNSNVSDTGVGHLTCLTALTSLDVRNSTCITDRGLRNMKALHCLRRLDLSHCHLITDAGLKELSVMTAMTHLNLRGCWKITGSVFSVLAQSMPLLEHLNLSECRVTNSRLKNLSSLACLRELHLRRCSDVGGAGLEHLTRLNLLVLGLGSTSIDDIGVASVAKMASVTRLDLDATCVSELGIRRIASSLTRLRTLNLSKVADVDDACLEVLSQLRQLRKLRLLKCRRITAPALVKLVAHLPRIQCIEVEGCWNIDFPTMFCLHYDPQSILQQTAEVPVQENMQNRCAEH